MSNSSQRKYPRYCSFDGKWERLLVRCFQIINHWLPFIHRHGPDDGPPETVNGSNKNFSTNLPFESGKLDVYVNGVLQRNGYDYTEDADCNGYTFTRAPRQYSGRDISTGDLVVTQIQHRYIVDD